MGATFHRVIRVLRPRAYYHLSRTPPIAGFAEAPRRTKVLRGEQCSADSASPGSIVCFAEAPRRTKVRRGEHRSFGGVFARSSTGKPFYYDVELNIMRPGTSSCESTASFSGIIHPLPVVVLKHAAVVFVGSRMLCPRVRHELLRRSKVLRCRLHSFVRCSAPALYLSIYLQPMSHDFPIYWAPPTFLLRFLFSFLIG